MEKYQQILEKYQKLNKEENNAYKYYQVHHSYPYTEVERTIEAKTYLKEGMIALRKHPRFCSIIPHNHNYLEINYVLKGQIEQIIDGNKLTLKQGELVFYSKKSIHEILPAGENDILLNFLILPEFFDFVFPFIDKNEAMKNFLINLFSNEQETNSIVFRVSEDETIQNILKNIIITSEKKQQDNNDVLRYYFMILILELTNHISTMEETKSSSYDSVLIIKMYSYIENNFATASLIDLAKNLNEDYNYLSKRIKKITGNTFQQLLEKQRLSVCETLLSSTSISISDIAEHIGYQNLTFFYKLFKKKEGMTPLEYRKIHLNN